VNCPIEERLELIRRFVPKIDNWSVCDSFCSGLKFIQSEQDCVFHFLQPYLVSDKEFEQRFAAVILLDYYIDENWLFRSVHALEQINAKEYYAKMAVAWAMAECYLHFPDEVLPILKQNRLDAEVQQKTLQKIIESRTISSKTREKIRAMKKKL
jgi:3-methyladenine DNA glycosylase AlkD